jgi:hypothetical protein
MARLPQCIPNGGCCGKLVHAMLFVVHGFVDKVRKYVRAAQGLNLSAEGTCSDYLPHGPRICVLVFCWYRLLAPRENVSTSSG